MPEVAHLSDRNEDDVVEERIVRLTGPQDIVTVWVAGDDVTPASLHSAARH